jgi:hypothetical protein
MSEYRQKLASPFWQRKRLEIMRRDEFACRFCGDKTEEQHIHHTVYLSGKEPWEYDDQYLLTLCHACHLEEERFKSNDPFLIGMLTMTGLSRRQLYALSVSLRRHFINAKHREMKFQDLTEYLEHT